MIRGETEEEKVEEDEEEEKTDRKKIIDSSISFVSVGTIGILEHRKTPDFSNG